MATKLTSEQKRVMDNWLGGYEPVMKPIMGRPRTVGYIRGQTVRWVIKNDRQRIWKTDSYAKDKALIDDWLFDAVNYFQILDLTTGIEYSMGGNDFVGWGDCNP